MFKRVLPDLQRRAVQLSEVPGRSTFLLLLLW
jgi:hypothetical protein